MYWFSRMRWSKNFARIYFRGHSKKLCFACINFCGKPKNAQNREILYKWKFNAVRYVSWPQCIEKLHIINKVGVQHEILDQKKGVETLKISKEILTVYFSIHFYYDLNRRLLWKYSWIYDNKKVCRIWVSLRTCVSLFSL